MAYSAFKLQTASADGKSIRNNITQATHGFVAGSVVRWDTATSGFTGAQANSAVNAEVSGVVEKVISTSQFTLVYQGEIDLSSMANMDDESKVVYFLSDTTAGELIESPPTAGGTVIKPMLTRTEQGKGLVTNYIGTLIGGEATVSLEGIQPAGVIAPYAGTQSDVPDGWSLCDGDSLVTSSYPELFSRIGQRYGFVQRIRIGRRDGIGVDLSAYSVVGGRVSSSFIYDSIGGDLGESVTVTGTIRAWDDSQNILTVEVDHLTKQIQGAGGTVLIPHEPVLRFPALEDTDSTGVEHASLSIISANNINIGSDISTVFYAASQEVTEFNKPDLRGRTIIGTRAGSTNTLYDYNLGQEGGEEIHQLTVQELPVHTHAISDTSSLNIEANLAMNIGDILIAGTGQVNSTGLRVPQHIHVVGHSLSSSNDDSQFFTPQYGQTDGIFVGRPNTPSGVIDNYVVCGECGSGNQRNMARTRFSGEDRSGYRFTSSVPIPNAPIQDLFSNGNETPLNSDIGELDIIGNASFSAGSLNLQTEDGTGSIPIEGSITSSFDNLGLDNTGESISHNNMQPYGVVNYIIKLTSAAKASLINGLDVALTAGELTNVYDTGVSDGDILIYDTDSDDGYYDYKPLIRDLRPNSGEDLIFAASQSTLDVTGTERMRLGTGGHLGINNADPQSRLHIGGTAGGDSEGIRLDGITAQVRIYEDTTTQNFMRIKGVSGEGFVFTGNDNLPVLTVGTSMGASADHMVGIGTTAPGASLDVRGSFKSVSVEVTNNGTNGYTLPAGRPVAGTTATVALVNDSASGTTFHGVTFSQWQTSAPDIAYMDGDVGIGIAAPGASLDVSGSLKSHGITATSTGISFGGTGSFEGRLAIGSGCMDTDASVASNLYVYGSDTKIVCHGTGDPVVEIRSLGNKTGAVRFHNSAGDVDEGQIKYEHSTNKMSFTTDGIERASIDNLGRFRLGSDEGSGGTGPLVPASSSASGNTGDIAWSTTHLYVCVEGDTWKRVALSTF